MAQGHFSAIRSHPGPDLHAHLVKLTLLLLNQEADWEFLALVEACLAALIRMGEVCRAHLL